MSTISATMAGAISASGESAMFFGGRDSEGRPANPIVSILIMLLASAAALIQMAISCAREFEADRGARRSAAIRRRSPRRWTRFIDMPRAFRSRPPRRIPRPPR
ncbi:MAG: hypothetical protein R3E48_17250 [Burkholderiaceae bacterium]